MFTIAGIGSRQSPPTVLDKMKELSVWCREHDISIRSGHASGADQAFEEGGDICTAYLPWKTFEGEARRSGVHYEVIEPTPERLKLVFKFHPNGKNLSYGSMKLMSRNTAQILGPGLNDPVDAVLYWTVNGQKIGGTGFALRMAEHYNIPTLYISETIDLEEIKTKLLKLKEHKT